MHTNILDLRAEQKPQKGDHRLWRGKAVVRRASAINTLVAHQTAAIFGPMAQPAVRHRRALNIAAHATAFRDDTGVLQTPVLWYVNSANGFNRFSVSVEFEGFYAGVPDVPSTPQREDVLSTWGSKPTPLDARAFATFCATAEALVEAARREGCPLEWVLAHRQSSGARRADPGYALWREVVLGYIVPKLGLKTRPDYTVDDGRPIPAQWGEGSAKY